MATVTFKVFVYQSTGYEKGFHFFESDDMEKYGYVLVGGHEFEYEIPADFNPVAAEVAAINKTIDKLTDEHTNKVLQLKGRIQELLCIENTPRGSA